METRHKKSGITRLQAWLHTLEDIILAGLLVLMISVAALQIFLRNVFESGLVWGDGLVRILVLWVGLLGAMVASRKGEHIKIDIIFRYIPERFKPAVHTLTNLFTAIVCSIVVFFGYRFVKFEYMDGLIAFSSVPAWICEIIIPVSFAVIAIRYILHFLISFIQMVRPRL